MQVYTSDKTSPRSFTWLWFIRIAAIVFSIIVLGVTANAEAAFGNSGCNAPAKLSYNLAVVSMEVIVTATTRFLTYRTGNHLLVFPSLSTPFSWSQPISKTITVVHHRAART